MSRPLASQSSRPTQPLRSTGCAESRNPFYFHAVAASLSLFALFCKLSSFVFNVLQPLWSKKRGGVGCLKTLFELHEIQTLFSPPCAILAGFVLNSSLSCSEAGQP